jgi:sugar phosphate isomerase/epimerase
MIGFCWSWDAMELDSRLRRLAAMGYDGVEFWDATLVQLDIDRLADSLRAAGIAAAQLCPYFNFVDGQSLWDESMRLAERYIAWSVKLDRPLLRVFTGMPWGDKTVGPDKATPQQWEAAIRGLQRICDMAAPHGVRFALECHTGSLMEDSPSTLRLIGGVARPNLGVNLQIPLKSGLESIQTSIEELGRYTWHMHAHNMTALVGGELMPLGEGVIDYPSVLRDLRERGFDGYVSIEHATYNGKRDPWIVGEHEAGYLRALREKMANE